jgi:hypothetical protein
MPSEENWHAALSGISCGVYIVEAVANNKRFFQRIAVGQ